MSDYSKQTWVDDDGSFTVGTTFSATRMGNIEEGIRVAGKKANLLASTSDGGVDEEDDRYGVEWTRQSDGSYVASRHVYEFSSNVTALDRTRGVNSAGKVVTHEIGAVHKATISSVIQSFGARLKLLATWGGRRQARVQMNTEAGGAAAGPDKLLLDDLGASDWMLNPSNVQDLTGTSAWNTSRQPNATHATLVMLTLGGGTGRQFSVYVGSTNPPTQRVAIGNDSGGWIPITFIVPPGHYYRYTQDTGAPAIAQRIEWTL